MIDLEVLEGRNPVYYDPSTENIHVTIYKNEEPIGKIIFSTENLTYLTKLLEEGMKNV